MKYKKIKNLDKFNPGDLIIIEFRSYNTGNIHDKITGRTLAGEHVDVRSNKIYVFMQTKQKTEGIVSLLCGEQIVYIFTSVENDKLYKVLM